MVRWICSLAVLGLLGATSAQADPVGKLRICRTPRIQSSEDRSKVLIPKGTGFVNGNNLKTGDELKPHFTVHTTADVIVPPKPGCVEASAVLDDNPENFTLTTRYGNLPSQLDAPGVDLTTRVIVDFK